MYVYRESEMKDKEKIYYIIASVYLLTIISSSTNTTKVTKREKHHVIKVSLFFWSEKKAPKRNIYFIGGLY